MNENNNPDSTEKFYKQKLKNKPNDLESIFKLSILYLQTKRFNLAKLLLQNGIKIYPNHAGLYNNLGATFEKLSDLKNARTCFEKAIKFN